MSLTPAELQDFQVLIVDNLDRDDVCSRNECWAPAIAQLAHCAGALYNALDEAQQENTRLQEARAEVLALIMGDPVKQAIATLAGLRRVFVEDEDECHAILDRFHIPKLDGDETMALVERLRMLDERTQAVSLTDKPGPPQPPLTGRQERLVRQAAERERDLVRRQADTLAKAIEAYLHARVETDHATRVALDEALAGYRGQREERG